MWCLKAWITPRWAFSADIEQHNEYFRSVGKTESELTESKIGSLWACHSLSLITKSSLRALQISINQWSYATLSDVHKGLYHDHLKPVEVLMFRKSVISVQSWNPPAALQVPDVTWIQQLCCAFLNTLPLQRPQSTEQRLRTGRKRGRISGHALGNSAVGMSCLGGTAQDTVEGNTMLLDRYME